MSKLSDAITANQGNRTAPPPASLPSMLTVSDQFLQPSAIATYRCYRLKVELQVSAKIQEADGRAITYALGKARQIICEEVFGEFRAPIYAVQAALMDYDTARAMELLDGLLKQMFEP